ncbi:hypothetical protein K470DRAFT_272907 [Piedraia hortae CBS 480.64]|uniref:PXA domain-containing protein n=1 Tax=Piedraia hortae CBS 480.64 TaxID=1314780 RepID=A0A6A7BT84_9PEZI|nr:hypothetical protein K470DRAFT_272907 [Piedraia hortae CBS 480.64]
MPTAQETFIQNTLCPQNSPLSHDTIVYTPLSSQLPPLTSNDSIDLELYTLISTLISRSVLTWYRPITPDTEFISEVVLTIAHCTRDLEARLRRVDRERVILDDIPRVVGKHIDAFEAARGVEDSAAAFAILRPHLVLEGKEDEWAQILAGKLAELVFPPDEWENPCERVLITEILSELVLKKVLLEMASQPELIWGLIRKMVVEHVPQGRSKDGVKSWTTMFWGTLQNMSSAWEVMRLAYYDAPKRGSQAKPVVDMEVWNLLARISELRKRMPWLTASAALARRLTSSGFCAVNSAVDRFLSWGVQKALDQDQIPPLLASLRTVIFPTVPLPPTMATSRECAAALVDAMPPAFRNIYFGALSTTGCADHVVATLRWLDDRQINKRLIVALVELLVVRVFPELEVGS